jgi:hypothetical protein
VSRRDALSALGVAALAALLQLPTFDRTMSLLDEGHILQFADLIRRGGELYRDAALLPLPGAFYLLALAFDVAGPSIAVARWLVLIEFAAFAAVVYLLVRQLAPASVAWTGVALAFLYKIWAFPHWQMYSYSTTAQLALAIAVLLVMRFHASHDGRTLAAAGLVTGLAILTKQDYGGAGLLALNAALLLPGPGRLRRLALFDGPALAVGAVAALHFLRQGLFLEMLRQTLLNHLIGISSGEYSSLPPLLPVFEASPFFRDAYGIGAYAPALVFTVDWGLVGDSAFFRESAAWDWCVRGFFYAPYAIAAVAALRCLRRRGALAVPEARVAYLRECTLAFYAIAAIAALNKPVDYVHVAVLYWPFLLLLLVWSHGALAARPRARRVAALVALVPALLVAGYSARLVWRLHTRYDTPLRGERAGVLVMADEEKVVGGAVDWLRSQTAPGERAAVLPYFPLISFLAARDAPHAETYTLWPIEYDASRERAVIDALEASAPVAVYHFTQAAQLPRMREYAPELFAYLVDHWEIERVFSDPGWGYMLAGLRRSEEPARGTPLLDPEAPPPRVHVERRRPPGPADAAAGRELHRFDLWPFRRVIALEPTRGGFTVLTLPVQVPPHAHLRTAVGVDPILWFKHPPSWVEFSIRAVTDGERRELFRKRLDPHRNFRDRGWFEVDLDLGAFAERSIELELATRCEGETGRSLSMGGFEIPRLVVP